MANQLPTRRQVVRADAGARAQRAWAARVAGATWAQAAELVGYSGGPVACRAVQRYFGRLPDIDREQQRALWRDRLEHLWRQTIRDAAEQRPGAVRSGVAVAQRAAALDGLDAPSRLELTNPDVSEFERVIQALVSSGFRGELEGDIFDAEIVEDDELAVSDPETGELTAGEGLA